MNKTMSDSRADWFLFFALGAFVISCVSPVLGLIVQLPLVIYLTCKCNIKVLPALMILMLGKGNLSLMQTEGVTYAIRLGITWTPASCFVIVAFFLAIKNILTSRSGNTSNFFALLWVISIIPALVMSYQGKVYGLVGAWSGPIMDFLIPGVYFWALGMSKTYTDGRDYFIRRMILILVGYMFLRILGIIAIHNFFTTSMFFCLSFCYISSRGSKIGMKFLIFVGVMMALYLLVFGRGDQLIAAEMEKHIGEDVAAADKYGSTFTAMAILLGSIILYLGSGRWISRSLMKGVPIIMVAVNICFVSFVIMTQSGNKAEQVDAKYETFSDRLKWKLFGDRGNVWTMGWEEVKTPPYIIKDMRQAYEYKSNGKVGIKMLPHNQFLTLLARRGLWLGGFLSIFIIWVWIRAFKAASYCLDDKFICNVVISVGGAIFFIVGITGQGVVTSVLWADSLCCLVLPGVLYGHWLERYKWGHDELVEWRSW